MKKYMKKVVITGMVALLASFLIYGVVADKAKFSPVGYNLKIIIYLS